MASEFAKKLIKKHEGLRLRMYKDSVGLYTIGYGRNLIGKGISLPEANELFENDTIDAEVALLNIFGPEILRESENRVGALLSMAFNLGESGLKGFFKFVDAVKAHDWELAAKEAEDSRWFAQVGSRGIEICELLEKG